MSCSLLARRLTFLLMSGTSLLMAANALATDSHEEPSQASLGVKRAQGTLGLPDNTSPKKQRTNPDTSDLDGVNAPRNLSQLEEAPFEILQNISHYLDNEALLAFSLTSKSIRLPVLDIYFNANTTPMTWASGPTFSSDFEGRKLRFTFTAKIMPQVMRAMLVMYKNARGACDHGRSIFAFTKTLARHESFSSQGQTLKTTPLWTFLSQIDNAHYASLPLAAFPITDESGAGDKMFANMLQYINHSFQKAPQDLDYYVAPKKKEFESPQSRMHRASALKEALINTTDVMARTQLWAQIITLFDNLTLNEMIDAADDYETAAKQSALDERFSLYYKCAWLNERILAIEPSPDNLRKAAQTYGLAGVWVSSIPHKVLYSQKSAGFWDRLLQVERDQTHIKSDLMEVIFVHSWIVTHMTDPVKKAPHYGAIAKYQEAYLENNDLSDPLDVCRLTSAAWAHVDAVAYSSNEQEKRTAYGNSVRLWERYLLLCKRPHARDLRRAYQAYDKLAQHALTPEEKAHASLKSVNLCEQLQKQLKALDASDMRDMASLYCRAAIYARVDTDKQSYARKGARMWDKYFTKETNADPQTRVLASSLYEQMASFAKTPGAKKRYLKKSAELMTEPSQSQTNNSLSPGH